MAFKETQTAEVSIPLPRSLDTRIYIRVVTLEKAVMVSLTTASQEEMGATTPMGTMVYALPDRFNPQQPLATTIFTTEATLEFTTRTARILARKANRPIYVTSSISFVNAGMGGTVEEEMEALKNVIEVVSGQLKKEGLLPTYIVSGKPDESPEAHASPEPRNAAQEHFGKLKLLAVGDWRILYLQRQVMEVIDIQGAGSIHEGEGSDHLVVNDKNKGAENNRRNVMKKLGAGAWPCLLSLSTASTYRSSPRSDTLGSKRGRAAALEDGGNCFSRNAYSTRDALTELLPDYILQNITEDQTWSLATVYVDSASLLAVKKVQETIFV